MARSRALYHIEQDKLKRTYQRHDMQQRMGDAWRLLGERLELLTREDAGNVVIGTFPKAANQ